MIGKISGVLDYVAEDHAMIVVAGVGYEVYASPKTLARLPEPGGRAALYTDLVVREDLMQLLGFVTVLEKEWHRLLTKVQGVGAKVSLAILDTLGAEGVGRAIAMGDAAAVKAAPGVGPKLAQRIVNELKDKAPNVLALGARAARAAAPAGAGDGDDDAAADMRDADVAEALVEAADAAPSSAAAEADAVSALLNLGVPAAEAIAAAAAAAAGLAEAGENVDAPAVIKAALKRLASPLG